MINTCAVCGTGNCSNGNDAQFMVSEVNDYSEQGEIAHILNAALFAATSCLLVMINIINNWVSRPLLLTL